MIVSEIVGTVVAGLGAALLMTASEFPFWKRWGMTGVGEWQVDSVIFARFYLRRPYLIEETRFPKFIVATHLLNGIIASLAFRFLFSIFSLFIPNSGPSFVYGALTYSMVLWIVFPFLGRRTFESLGRLTISNRGLMVSLFSHAVYGIFLGLFLFLIPS